MSNLYKVFLILLIFLLSSNVYPNEDFEKTKVLYFLGFDQQNPNSIYNSVIKLYETRNSKT